MKQNSFDALFSAAKNGDAKQIEKLGNEAAASLNEEQKKTVEKAMSDPEFLRSLLSSQKAQEILKKLKGDE